MTESKLNGVSTTYTYDKVGNVLSTTMANGTQTVKYAYDQLNRPVKYTDALGKSETYKYNNYGDMTLKVDRNGVTTNYTYDGLHRLTSEKAVKNGVTSAKYFTYALTGQLDGNQMEVWLRAIAMQRIIWERYIQMRVIH